MCMLDRKSPCDLLAYAYVLLSLQLGVRVHQGPQYQCGWSFSSHQAFPPVAEKEANKGCGEHQLHLRLHFCKFQRRLWRISSSLQFQQGCHQYAYAICLKDLQSLCL